MELAHAFFAPLGVHVRSALAELPDNDLMAAHRVFSALIDAMSTFEGEVVAQQPKSATKRSSTRNNHLRDGNLTKETEHA
jgi:hypothetical protein